MRVESQQQLMDRGDKEGRQLESQKKTVHVNSTRVYLVPALMSEPEVLGMGMTLEEYGGLLFHRGHMKRMSPQHHNMEDEELAARTAQPECTI
jgi:hypothetical protein